VNKTTLLGSFIFIHQNINISLTKILFKSFANARNINAEKYYHRINKYCSCSHSITPLLFFKPSLFVVAP